ncbi:MAG: alanine racemase [Actinobacteria bacterium]|nr:alanine racemase [Actinomycetota bacterium]
MTHLPDDAGGPLRPAVAEIDLEAVDHNVRLLRERVAPAEVIAVVKADAYGHGAVPVARAALGAGATWLAVALVEEAEELRAAGVTVPMLLLSEPPPAAAARVLAADLTPSVYTPIFAEALRVEAARRGRPVRVHVNADTGMGRVGVARTDWDGFLRTLRAWPDLEVQGLMSHFACADQPGHPSVRQQQQRFEEFLQLARTHGFDATLVHAANSAAALTIDESHYDAVRLGIAMYGAPPSPALASAAELRPVMRLVADVAFAKRVGAHSPISYGHSWSAPVAGVVATVPLGYADGVPRLLSNRGEVVLSGVRRPIVGAVTMDMFMVWCGDDQVDVGDQVVLLGRQEDAEVTATEWAHHADTIAYEILSRIAPRVPRVYLTGQASGG